MRQAIIDYIKENWWEKISWGYDSLVFLDPTKTQVFKVWNNRKGLAHLSAEAINKYYTIQQQFSIFSWYEVAVPLTHGILELDSKVLTTTTLPLYQFTRPDLSHKNQEMELSQQWKSFSGDSIGIMPCNFQISTDNKIIVTDVWNQIKRVLALFSQ